MGIRVILGQKATKKSSQTWLLGFFMIVSWMGMYIHNRMEFPSFTLLNPENAVPALMSTLLFASWLFLPYHRLSQFLIFGWAIMHLTIGAVLSVLPLPAWAFAPDQTLSHYMVHLAYALLQLPLIVLLITLMKRKGE